MGKMKELDVVIEEIARVALGMVFDEIGHELDLSDEELLRVRDYLEAKLNQEQTQTRPITDITETDDTVSSKTNEEK